MNYHKEKGIILKTTKWQEADLIVSFLMSNGSLETLLAKNALKSKKRFGGGVLEPSHFVSFQWHTNKNQKAILDEAIIIDDFSHIRKSYDHIGIAMRALNTIQKISKEGLEGREVFDLLGNFLKSLKNDLDLSLYYLHFEIRLLKVLGILPNDERFNVFFNYTLKNSNKITKNNSGDISKIKSYIETIKNDYF